MNKLLITICCAGLFTGCVKKSLYQTELTNRQKSEEREKVLKSELLDRKMEAEKMIANIGDLNKTIGKQESEIAGLNNRIAQLTANADKTSTSLASEKAALEKELNDKTSQLNKSNQELTRLQKIISQRNTALESLEKVVSEAYTGNADISTSITAEGVALILPDKTLFDASGVIVPAAGKALLEPLAKLLAERPALNVEVVSYTDNQLPKGNKTITDTWDWSLRRATAVTRLLITDFSINANQLTPIGKGEFYPVATNETPEGRARNRRTEILLMPKLAQVK